MERYRHIAFCALVSLGIHNKEHGKISSLQENIYILRWLKAARDKKCFPPVFISYLEKLSELACQQMSTASMRKKLEAFYNFSSPDSVAQSEYYRFKIVQTELNLAGYPWYNLTANDLKKKLNDFSGQGIFTEKNAFSCAFTLQGKLSIPLRMIIPVMDEVIKNTFARHSFKLTAESNNNLLWTLTPCQIE